MIYTASLWVQPRRLDLYPVAANKVFRGGYTEHSLTPSPTQNYEGEVFDITLEYGPLNVVQLNNYMSCVFGSAGYGCQVQFDMAHYNNNLIPTDVGATLTWNSYSTSSQAATMTAVGGTFYRGAYFSHGEQMFMLNQSVSGSNQPVQLFSTPRTTIPTGVVEYRNPLLTFTIKDSECSIEKDVRGMFSVSPIRGREFVRYS